MLPLNGFIHFLSMNGNFRGGFNAQADFIAANVHHCDLDVITDENAFIALPG